MTSTTRDGPRITIVDVARQAGVSIGTVSRVINGKDSVGAELRERVLDAAQALGYRPSFAAQAMRSRSTRLVGLMVPNVANPLFSPSVSAIEEVLYQNGYNMMLSNSRDRPETEREIVTLFHRRRFDGMVVALSNEGDAATLQLLADMSVPVVLLERECTLPLDAVTSDHQAGARQAFDYLLGLGHRRIGLVTASRSALPGRARSLAYAAAHKAAGVPVDSSLAYYNGYDPDAGYEDAYRMLIAPDPPTAIVAGANQMPDVLRAVRMLKLAVPKRLSLVMIGDTDVASLHQPPLTTVRWDMRKVGAAAAELLLARIAGEVPAVPPRRIALPTELVVRRSCCPPT